MVKDCTVSFDCGIIGSCVGCVEKQGISIAQSPL